jgi:hypothetical protein
VVNWTYYPASTTPNALDIVWCCFPELSELRPGPKPRPALVRRVLRDPSSGHLAVEVAFGTSNLKLDRNIPHQLVISNRRDLYEAGLRSPTRFDLTQTKILPWCREFFTELREGDGAVIGKLSAFKRHDLNETKASLPRPAEEVRKTLALAAAHRANITSPSPQPDGEPIITVRTTATAESASEPAASAAREANH